MKSRRHSGAPVLLLFFIVLLTALYAFTKAQRLPFYSYSQTASCSETLQSLIDKAPSGSTLVVPPCVYREKVTINKPLVIDGQGKAEIRGSDIWTGWTKKGTTWVRGTVPTFSSNDRNCSKSNTGLNDTDPRKSGQCNWQEQVFFDGRELQQVSADPKQGEFMLDSSHQIVLADDPNGHTVEVTTRQRWVEITGNNVTVRGMTMKHASNPSQSAALYANYKNSLVVEDSILQYAHGPLIGLHHGNGNIIRRNDLGYSGHLGVSGSHTVGELIQDNKIHHNNTQGVTCTFECGGLKEAGSTGLVIENNEVYENYGYGLWCDIDCDNVTVRGNKVHDNKSKGIVQEISGSAKIYNNSVWNNGFAYTTWGWGAGILVQNSKGVEVYNNVAAWNADGIGIIAQNRAGHTDVTGSSIHDNVAIADTGMAFFGLSDNGSSVKSANQCTNNRIYIQGNATVDWASCGTKITKSEAERVLQDAGIPTQPNTVITPTNIPSPTDSIPTLSPTSSAQCNLKQNGDANCDGKIDLIDFEVWRKEFMKELSTQTADFNGDTLVNLQDFEAWRRQIY